MAKLQKQISRRTGKKEYSKYVIIIPENKIKEAGFKEGEDLSIISEKDRIIIEKI
ncbi:MAG: hypothetical protein WAU65_03115 [Candidatus Nanoarchaeia archaeon]